MTKQYVQRKKELLEEQIADIENWRGGPEEEAAAKMRDIGLEGIRYADFMSRGDNARGATSNFVVFDDRLIEIARRYSIALPLAGAVLAGTMTPREAMAEMREPDAIIEEPVDTVDPYSAEEDPTVDPLPLVLDMPPTDTQVNNVAVLETMGRLAEGQDAGIANTYEQAKADAEFNSDAVKAKFTEFLTTFNRQTTEAIVGEADPEIVADKIQEDAAIEQSIIAPYMGAVVKSLP